MILKILYMLLVHTADYLLSDIHKNVISTMILHSVGQLLGLLDDIFINITAYSQILFNRSVVWM